MPRPAPAGAPLYARIAFAVLCAVFALACLAKARLIGDGMEYLAMAQGFVAHGSPELRRSDVEAFKAMPPHALARARLQPGMLEPALERIERDGDIVHGFARALDGSVRAIHFWMYSLLAAPFYALAVALGQNPFMALAALNLAILALAAWRLVRWFPTAGLPELSLLLLMGPIYYTVWSGPELMAGCCVLFAVLAALRRDLALTVALAGLGATQNPSIAGLIPAAAGYALLYRWRPALALAAPPASARRLLRAVLLIAAGIALAVLPYWYNQRWFGTPSIIGHYYTDPGLVRPERLFSFLFDLNQGLVFGLPGLFSCAAALLLACAPERRRAWMLHTAIALLLCLGLALPTLAASNWSSGAIVVARYAYWTAMPLLAVALAGLAECAARRRWSALAVAVLLQALAAWLVLPPRHAPTRHGRLAGWVLDHAPQRYHPDPEIFLERERGREDFTTHDQVVLHRGPQGPNKLLRFWANSEDTAGLCAPGSHLAAGRIVTLASGWRYHDAPLRCIPGAAPALRIAVGPAPSAGLSLGAGWSPVAGQSVWNVGQRARLRVTPPPGRQVRALGLVGYYHAHGVRASRVVVNGTDLGTHALGQAPLALPEALGAAPVLDIALTHTRAPRPTGGSDPRPLGFFLHGVHLEFAQ
ncbi:hypothetical protein [Massilia sp. MS-15]|uniref:hypothetical protein n=1 Tax=Massilia sp. MS-15 TaxID=2878200 RepID=UPI001CD54C7B|nr:hypothetical protein [Massilia sp. MS-15]MCA1245898.1 hypothetical protein [Massilia sp. MS-15]